MSRPWQFEEKARSPFDRPPANNQPAPSFQPNVNRNKTKRWVEAKSYTYDGDDWGGYDPYDEYGDYDEPEPQSQHPPAPVNTNIRRQNSFDAGDERRNFSAGAPPPSATQDFAPTQPPYASSSARSSQDDSRPSTGNQVRRDFSQPAHVPPPLRMGANPPPPLPTHNMSMISPDASHFPPRQSSLSQGTPPYTPIQPPVELPTTTSPRIPQEETSPKPRSFVRPSDIYKRMEEEREKERRSMDSARPSVDLTQGQSHAQVAPPGTAAQERTSMDSAPRSDHRRPSLGFAAEGPESMNMQNTPHRPPPELKNEYGFQGFTVNNPVLARALGANLASTSDSLPVAKTRGDDNEGLAQVVRPESPEYTRTTTALPPVNRVASGFGEDFFGSVGLPVDISSDETAQPASTTAEPMRAPAQVEHVPQNEPSNAELQHQPSLGFRSAVHQAFDRRDDDSVPPTPISRDNSQSYGGSEVSRSNTDSTAGISPIMSRVPSSATAESKARAAEAREVSIPPIAEEGSIPSSPSSRPTSALPGVRKPLPAHSRNVSAEGPPASFTPGYRRDLGTPSPSNSPARSPALEASRRLSAPMSAEMTTDSVPHVQLENQPYPSRDLGSFSVDTSPTVAENKPANYALREADLADTVSSSPDKDVTTEAAEAALAAQSRFLKAHSPISPSSPSFQSLPRSATPVSGRNSPGLGRVRELAGRFNEIDDISRRNSAVSLKSQSSFSSWGRGDDRSLRRTETWGTQTESPVKEDVPEVAESPVVGYGESLLPRPEAARGASFRPHLPGEWVSYAVTPGATGLDSPAEPAAASLPEPQVVITPHDDEPSVPALATPTTTKPVQEEEFDLTPTTFKRPLPKEDPAASEHSSPIAALKSAGDALGAALMASMGTQHKAKDFAQPEPESEPLGFEERRRPSIGDVYMRPLALQRTASSVPSTETPTPQVMESTEPEQHTNRASGYFGRFTSPTGMTDFTPQSVDESPMDTESDRLRREIERSLSPERVLDAVQEDKQREQDALDAPKNVEMLHATGKIPSPEPTMARVVPESQETIHEPPPTVSDTAPLPPAPQSRSAAQSPESSAQGGMIAKLTNAVEAGLDAYAPTAVSSYAHQYLDQPHPTETHAESSLPAKAVTQPVEPARSAIDARSGPGILDQRFSWETGSKGLFDPDVTGSEQPKAYERPRSSGLHVVNTNISDESEDPESVAEPSELLHAPARASDLGAIGMHNHHLDAPSAIDLAGSPVSPIASPDMHNERARQLKSGDVPPSPIEAPQSITDLDVKPLPDPMSQHAQQQETEANPSSPSAASPTTPGAASRISPFREILALRSAPERISSYNSTRDQFASMDTGLRDWLNSTLSSHPEHAHLATDATIKPSATLGSIRHKHSPSIIKIAKQFGSSNRDSTVTEAGDPAMPAAQRTPSMSMRSTSGPMQPQQLQAKGKDLLHSAGLLGGKATVGAKGLFAKGKNRFNQSRTDKASTPTPTRPTTASSASRAATSILFPPPVPASAQQKPIPSVPVQQEASPSVSAPPMPEHPPILATDKEPDPSYGPTPVRIPAVHQSMDAPRVHEPMPQHAANPVSDLPPLPVAVPERAASASPALSTMNRSIRTATEHSSRAPSRTSNRLSATFNRLREVSKSRSASRPSSVVIGSKEEDNTGLDDAKGMSMPTNVVLGYGFEDKGDLGSGRRVDVTGDQENGSIRKELWDADNGKVAAKEEIATSGTLRTDELNARLGVLPSPGLEAFPDLGIERHLPEAQKEGAQVAVLTPQEEEDELYSITPTEIRHPVRSLEEREGKDVGSLRGEEGEVPTAAPETVAQALPAPGITALGQEYATDEASIVPTPEPAGLGPVSRAPEYTSPEEDVADEAVTRVSTSESWEKNSDTGSVRRTKPHRPSEVSAFDPEEETGISRTLSRRSSVSSIEREPVPPLPRSEAPAVYDEEAGMAAERAHLEQQTPTESSRPAMIGRSSLPSQQRMRAASIEQSRAQEFESGVPARPYQAIAAETMPDSPTLPDQTRFAYGRYRVADAENGQPSTPLAHVQNAAQFPVPRLQDDRDVEVADADDQAPSNYPHTIQPPYVQSTEPLSTQQPYTYPAQDLSETEDWQSGTPGQHKRELHAEQGEYGIPTLPKQEAMYEAVPMPPPKDNVPQDIRSQRFAAPVIDPRQQGIEYQLPGVGPPEPKAGQRKDSPPGPGGRINPQANAINLERTFSGDAVPQVQSKRRSGIFETFRRISSGGEAALGRDNGSEKKQRFEDQDPAVIAAQKARENTARPATTTLQKVQRSSTTASQPDPEKRKRFSRLGSLFGRSNTNVGNAAQKPNKLMKAQPRSSSSGHNTPTAPAASYPAYEAMKRQQYAGIPQLPTAQYQSRGVEDATFGERWQQQARERSARVQNEMPIPPGGWYAPTNQPQPAYNERPAYNQQPSYDAQPQQVYPAPRQQVYSPQQQVHPPQQEQVYPTPPQHRHLHSEGPGPGQIPRYTNVPEAFQPTAASYRNSYGPGPASPEIPQQYEQTIAPQTAYRVQPGAVQPVQQQRSPSYEQRPRGYSGARAGQGDTGRAGQTQMGNEVQLYAPPPPPRQNPLPVVSPVHSRDYAMGPIGQAMTRPSPPQQPVPQQQQQQQRRDTGFRDAPQQASSPAMYGVQSFSPTSPYRRSTTTTTTSTSTVTTTSRRGAQHPVPNQNVHSRGGPVGPASPGGGGGGGLTAPSGPPQQASSPALYNNNAMTPPQQTGEKIPPLPPLPALAKQYSPHPDQRGGLRDYHHAQQQQQQQNAYGQGVGAYGYPSPPYSPPQQQRQQQQQRGDAGFRNAPLHVASEGRYYDKPSGPPQQQQQRRGFGGGYEGGGGKGGGGGRGGGGHGRQTSEEGVQMRGASYPGQEWTPY